jgi:hypothetical protein
MRRNVVGTGWSTGPGDLRRSGGLKASGYLYLYYLYLYLYLTNLIPRR